MARSPIWFVGWAVVAAGVVTATGLTIRALAPQAIATHPAFGWNLAAAPLAELATVAAVAAVPVARSASSFVLRMLRVALPLGYVATTTVLLAISPWLSLRSDLALQGAALCATLAMFALAMLGAGTLRAPLPAISYAEPKPPADGG